jgi:hypothetical protein
MTCKRGVGLLVALLLVMSAAGLAAERTQAGNRITNDPPPSPGVTVGSSQSFEFTRSYGANVFLADGEQNLSALLDPGVYSVDEIVLEDWVVTSATCDDGSPISAIDLSVGETVRCTFVNEPPPPPDDPPPPEDPPPPTDQPPPDPEPEPKSEPDPMTEDDSEALLDPEPMPETTSELAPELEPLDAPEALPSTGSGGLAAERDGPDVSRALLVATLAALGVVACSAVARRRRHAGSEAD